MNLTCSITFLWSEGCISSPVRHSYLSFFPDDNAGVFAASLLISYCDFSSSVFLISFYILSLRFSLKCRGLYDARVVSITQKEYHHGVHFLQRFIKSLK